MANEPTAQPPTPDMVGVGSKELLACECVNWARAGIFPLTAHHPNCAKYNPVKDCMEIIRPLLKGIEYWAADEDGVHPECWTAYKRAKEFVGEFNYIPDEEHANR